MDDHDFNNLAALKFLSKRRMNRRRGSQRGVVGRVRLELSRRLEEIGIDVRPEELDTQYGFYRSKYHDLASWMTPERRKNVASWDTMTACTGKWPLYIVNDDGFTEVAITKELPRRALLKFLNAFRLWGACDDCDKPATHHALTTDRTHWLCDEHWDMAVAWGRGSR